MLVFLGLFGITVGLLLIGEKHLPALQYGSKQKLGKCYILFSLPVIFCVALGMAVMPAMLTKDMDRIAVNFCKDDFTLLPLGFGDDLKRMKFSTKKIDSYLSARDNPLCKDLCPCMEINLKNWPATFNAKKYNFKGDVQNFD